MFIVSAIWHGAYLGSDSCAAKCNVSRTVREPTSASSCSTYELSLRNETSDVGAPLMASFCWMVAFAVAARCASTLSKVVFPDPLVEVSLNQGLL